MNSMGLREIPEANVHAIEGLFCLSLGDQTDACTNVEKVRKKLSEEISLEQHVNKLVQQNDCFSSQMLFLRTWSSLLPKLEWIHLYDDSMSS